MPRVIGIQRAKELAFSGREIDVHEAKSLGIVSEIHSPEALEIRANEIALSFANASLAALSISKRAFNASINSTLEAMLEIESSGQGVVRSSDYHRRAIDAFLKKQPLPFSWPKRA